MILPKLKKNENIHNMLNCKGGSLSEKNYVHAGSSRQGVGTVLASSNVAASL